MNTISHDTNKADLPVLAVDRLRTAAVVAPFVPTACCCCCCCNQRPVAAVLLARPPTSLALFLVAPTPDKVNRLSIRPDIALTIASSARAAALECEGP